MKKKKKHGNKVHVVLRVGEAVGLWIHILNSIKYGEMKCQQRPLEIKYHFQWFHQPMYHLASKRTIKPLLFCPISMYLDFSNLRITCSSTRWLSYLFD